MAGLQCSSPGTVAVVPMSYSHASCSAQPLFDRQDLGQLFDRPDGEERLFGAYAPRCVFPLMELATSSYCSCL